MRFCLMLEGQEDVTWDRWLSVAELCDRLGFDGVFTSDHYHSVFDVAGRGSNDAWTLLAGLAARTERVRLGTMVSPVTFRLPGVFAKIVTTVDHISGGRVDVALGAGWWEKEHRRYGIPFPSDTERMEMLEEQLEIVHRLLSGETVTVRGGHYTLEDGGLLHRPVQRPHPPVIVGGGGGPRMARLVARWANEFNTYGGTPAELRERYGRIRDAVGSAGRDPSSVVMSLMATVVVGEDEPSLRRRVEAAIAFGGEGASYDDFLAGLEREDVVGTPERAAERLTELADAGVERIMLNVWSPDDEEMIELLAAEVFPKVQA
jgi:F420-dependent oxidoreductase-like protein